MSKAEFLSDHARLQADQGTVTSMMSIYGTLVVHGFESALHTSVLKLGNESDAMVTSSMISMYSKCGAVNDWFFLCP